MESNNTHSPAAYLPANHYRALFLLLSHTAFTVPGCQSFIQAQKDSGISVFFMHIPVPVSTEDACRLLHKFCTAHSILPSSLLLVSDEPLFLTAAASFPAASIGFQADGCLSLPAPYLFQTFDADDLSTYFYESFCRFHNQPVEIAHTARLTVRETVPLDLPWLEQLYADADSEQLRFFPASYASFSAKEKEAFLQAYSHAMYTLYSFGMYTVVHNSTGCLIGHCGFGLAGSLPALGYIIASKYRRQNYGAEACTACLAYLKDQEAYPAVLCHIHNENKASLSLAKKLGFKPVPSEALMSILTFQLDFA